MTKVDVLRLQFLASDSTRTGEKFVTGCQPHHEHSCMLLVRRWHPQLRPSTLKFDGLRLPSGVVHVCYAVTISVHTHPQGLRPARPPLVMLPRTALKIWERAAEETKSATARPGRMQRRNTVLLFRPSTWKAPFDATPSANRSAMRKWPLSSGTPVALPPLLPSACPIAAQLRKGTGSARSALVAKVLR